MIICNSCGHTFESAPYIPPHKRREYDPVLEYGCPHCGSADIDEADEFPKCRNFMKKSDRLCVVFRTVLLARFKNFIGGLLPQEQDQLDDWIEGESVTNCEGWKP